MKIIDEVQFEKLVAVHQKYIYGIVDKFNFSNESRNDLYVSGLIGFFDAYKNYNPSYNTKFITYAYNYIKHEVIDHQQSIKYPHFTRSEIKNYRIIKNYVEKNSKEYLSENDLTFLSKKLEIPIQEIWHIFKFGRAKIYLSQIKKNSDTTETYYDSYENLTINDTSRNAEKYYLRKVVNERLERLTETQQTVLNGLFGLNDNDNDKISILELSVELNVSEERIRQIRYQAIYELGKDSKLKQIYDDHFK